jgi:hypothetical protein
VHLYARHARRPGTARKGREYTTILALLRHKLGSSTQQRFYGIAALAWLEYVLSSPPESTEVVT